MTIRRSTHDELPTMVRVSWCIQREEDGTARAQLLAARGTCWHILESIVVRGEKRGLCDLHAGCGFVGRVGGEDEVFSKR